MSPRRESHKIEQLPGARGPPFAAKFVPNGKCCADGAPSMARSRLVYIHGDARLLVRFFCSLPTRRPDLGAASLAIRRPNKDVQLYLPKALTRRYPALTHFSGDGAGTSDYRKKTITRFFKSMFIDDDKTRAVRLFGMYREDSLKVGRRRYTRLLDASRIDPGNELELLQNDLRTR